MINSIYQLMNKGSWRALSFTLAIVITLSFFFNVNQFAFGLRSANPLWVIMILWSTVIIWIHGIGFEIRFWFWQLLFMPIFGMLIALIALVQNWL